MSLSPSAAHLAAEIDAQDWSDAPYRIDRAGHHRDDDSHSRLPAKDPLTVDEAEYVKTNVMWVTAQVLAYQDPHFDVHAYAAACGISRSIRLRTNGTPSGTIDAGLRTNHRDPQRRYAMPGGTKNPNIRIATNEFGADAAICGEVKLHSTNPGFSHNIALLQPRTFAVTTYQGLAHGEGYIRGVARRGDWYVVEWESFWALNEDQRYPCTAPHGRHYVDVVNM